MTNRKLTKPEAQKLIKENLGVDNANFYAKKTFKARDGGIKISLFAWEMKQDFYCQILVGEEPKDKELTIYYIPYDEVNFTREYDEFPAQEGRESYRKYHFYLDEIRIVFREEGEKEDTSYGNMTLRDYASIQLGIPCSNKAWLNEVIKRKNGTKQTTENGAIHSIHFGPK